MGTPPPCGGASPFLIFWDHFLKNLAKVHYLYFCYTLDKIVICTYDFEAVLPSKIPIMPYAPKKAWEIQ